MIEIDRPLAALLVGDSHGNLHFMKTAIEVAVDNDLDLIIQLGDFGFWPEERDQKNRPFADPINGFAATVNRIAKANHIPIWVLRGNHDWRVEADSFLPPTDLTPGLHTVTDGQRMKINGWTVLFTGGAVSVDQAARTEGISWWPDEVITEQDVANSIEGGPVDLWLTHDSVHIPPQKRPLSFGVKIDTELSIQKHRMTRIFEAVQPKLHVHGHWHFRYSAPTKFGKVVGLSCESQKALAILEFDEELKIGG